MSVAAPGAAERGQTATTRLVIDPCRSAWPGNRGRSWPGVTTAAAEAVLSDATARLGFPSDAYVVALVGGTGVGKSSLLNSLAGKVVTHASARRPTTVGPVALVPRASAADLADLLEWLERPRRAMSSRATTPVLAGIAVLDLPDIDSTAPDHRARVEAILPRIDAVIWVTDPEKYGDAVLHEDFFVRWLPRLANQVVVINKIDRVAPDDAAADRRDIGLHLSRLTGAPVPVGGAPPPPVILPPPPIDVRDHRGRPRSTSFAAG